MGKLESEDRNDLSVRQFAVPQQRKEPLEDAPHVRNAVARFNQAPGVNEHERVDTWERIKSAAKEFDVELREASWRERQKSSD